MNAKNKSKNATTLDEWHHLFFSFLCSQISIYLTSLCSLWNKKKVQKNAISKQPVSKHNWLGRFAFCTSLLPY